MPDLDITVLIVDDFATMRKIVRNVLKEIGFKTILEADDGKTALGVLKREKVDFIVSDWNMPQMSGLELLKTVRSTEEYKDIPFLMLTAEGQREQVLEAIKHKVNNYIVKPFTPQVFREKVDKILEAKLAPK